ncbi:hypothetical protein SAMN05216378_0725 [Paenibacillus catalpae]|uniref:Uncharacterized protein n=2 Tax=Paenibacillus catalpae TaxID=1045775 RepID=A0A1I1TZT8_9BACL|nr:hypothetical protein SAMN05216378_0725 [Paenibacillus catalpae]
MKSNKYGRFLYFVSLLALFTDLISPLEINAKQMQPPDQIVENEYLEKRINPIGQIYKANSHLAKTKFKTENNIIKMTRMEKGSKVLSTTLMTYAQYCRKELRGENPGTIIENERMVWMIKVDFPKGIKTRGGNFSKAVQVTVFDAETGNLLTVSTIGIEDTRN